MPSVRNSKQRNLIFSELSSRYDHPTADELYIALKKKSPSLSLATVYRNLKQLCEDGKVKCISFDNVDRFDATTMNHYHLACMECNRLYDVDIPLIPEIDIAQKSLSEGNATSYSLIFSGVCNNCKKYN